MKSGELEAIQFWLHLRVADPLHVSAECVALESCALSTSCLSPCMLEQLWKHEVRNDLTELLEHRKTMGYFCASLGFPSDVAYELECKRDETRYKQLVDLFYDPELDSEKLTAIKTFSEKLFFMYGKIQKQKVADFRLLCKVWEPRVCYTAMKLYSVTPQRRDLGPWIKLAQQEIPALKPQLNKLEI